MLPHDSADTTNGIVEVTARIRVPATNAFCVDIDAYDCPPERYTKRAFHARFWPDGKVSHYARPKPEAKSAQHDPEEWTKPRRIDVPELRFTPQEWFHVTIRADLEAATFDLTVAGKTVRGLPFAQQNLHRIQTIGFYPNKDNCTMHVDSVRVIVTP